MIEMEMDVLQIFMSISLLGLLGSFLWLYKELVMKPGMLRSKLRKQGINGPTPSFLLGNIREMKMARDTALNPARLEPGTCPTDHKVAAILFPFLEKWRKDFGQMFMFSLGTIQILHTNHPDMVRDITTCTSLDLGKPSYQQKRYGPLLGHGILTSNGARWVHQRKTLAPELYMEKVKGMVSLITGSADMVVNSWRSMIEAQGGAVEIEIDDYMRKFSGDVISKACFGSNFSEGEEIFMKLRALQKNISTNDVLAKIPGMKYLPTTYNKEAWGLEKEVRSLLLQIVKERRKLTYDHKDLLQMVIEGANHSTLSQHEIDQFIEDNCKNIYLAGYETTATAASWLLMLLASNQEWQARVRAEVTEVCQGRVPDADMLRKMKQLTMVMHESLRLYPPVSVVSREALKDMKFGNIDVPKNVSLWTIVVNIHTDPEIWGPDSYNFKPERFEKGITGACKFPHLYMPFGVGPRMCLGQNLAMTELKILVSHILSNFSFSLSPQYVHSPVLNLVLEPQHRVKLMVNKP